MFGSGSAQRAAAPSKTALSQMVTTSPNGRAASPARREPATKAAEPVPRTQPYWKGLAPDFVSELAEAESASASESGASGAKRDACASAMGE